MKLLTLTAFAAAIGTSWAACTGLDLGVKGCLCPSGQYFTSGSCADNTVCVAGPAFPATVNTTFDSSGMNLTTINMTGYDMDVTLRLNVPALQTRTYTNVFIAGPDAEPLVGCNAAGNVFTNVTQLADVTTGSGRCEDVFNFIATFANLRACGFAVSSLVDTATTGYQTWDGTVRLTYDEIVTVGNGADYALNQTRSALIDFPFRLEFKSQESFAMSMSNITVYAKQQIDFVILNQVIPRDGSNPTAVIGFTVQYPYAINAWLNDGDLTKTVAGSPANSISAKMITQPPYCDLNAYTAVGDNTGGTCYKAGMTMNFTKGAGTDCQFTGQGYLLGFSVRCADGLAAADCPLQANDTGNATFTITSDNWCTANADAQTINNVIRMDQFYSAQVSNWSLVQNAFRVNDRAYFVILFTGLNMNTIKLTRLQRKFANDPTTLPGLAYADVGNNLANVEDIVVPGLVLSGAIPPLVSGQVGTLQSTPLTSNGNLGKGTDDLSYYFSALMNDDLLGTGATAGIVRGADWFLQLRATVDVTYNATSTASGRRRRRQSDTTGSGSIESNQQSIQAAEDAEAAPSSAVRSAPVLAVALALLSAVLMA